MKCANCVYYENEICYRKGTRVCFNNNICEDFIVEYSDDKEKIIL